MNGEEDISNITCTTPRKLKFEQLRADYELFLQTFEKPTWIYRLLHRRHQISPFMLHRNLSYLGKGRWKSKNKCRKNFKMDNMLESISTKKKDSAVVSDENRKFCLNLTFGGFFHGPGFAEEIFQTNDTKTQDLFKDDFVNINVELIQVAFKRKKGKDDALTVVPLGKCKAPWNPRTQLLLPGTSVQLSVPPNVFSETNRSFRTQILSITVSLKVPKRKSRKAGRRKNEDGMEEPPSKRYRASVNTDSQTEDNDTESPILEKESSSFVAELIIFDRHKTCLLSDGDYELLLQSTAEATDFRNKDTFETKFKNKLGPFAAFSFGPTVKFNLKWTSESPANIASSHKSLLAPYVDKRQPLTDVFSCNEIQSKSLNMKPKEGLPKVYYQFIYGNNTRQQTEAREGTTCPWCDIQCGTMYGLLRHLKCCHTRFSFLYTCLKKGHRIDVCLNDTFEGSLSFDGIKDIGFIDIDHAPVKRKSTTEIIVLRPFIDSKDMKEFMEPDKRDFAGITPLALSHQRSYFHSTNNQEIPHLNEFDVNSEDEGPPDWLQEKTHEMIEEFTDVNKGEKVLMQLWNMHVLEKSYLADFTVAAGCVTFVESYGTIILKKNLVRNFMIHLNNLFEFQVISQTSIVNAMDALIKMKTTFTEE